MIRNQEEDEFVAVRVQDPRMQNEGSWNSYVDYKIFLHTNSKAFTAKTSCVRRRYSEFAWLKKKLQKNAGLVPVPELPGKSFLYFSNEDFLERRRKGLQAFLDNVVNMTVCLSDSQLHLFLQTQLPVGHIQDCVQGHTPYSVTDAILTYASSNRGYAQAQEEDSIKEPSLTVSYESMESPAPHQPFQTPKDLFRPDLLSCGDSDPLEELGDQDPVEFLHKETSSVRVLQRDDHLEAVMEDSGPTEVTFFLGDIKDASDILAEQSQQRSCQIQTPVEVHLPMGPGFEEESAETLDPEEKTVIPEPGETAMEEEEVEGEEETLVNAATSQEEEELEVVCMEEPDPETQEDGEVLVEDTEVHIQEAEVHVENAEVQVEEVEVHVEEAEVHVQDAEVHVQDAEVRVEDAEIHVQDAEVARCDPEEQNAGDDITQLTDQQEVEVVGTKGDSDDEDGRSSSNGSIVKVSDEESVCDDEDDDVEEEVEEASSGNIMDLHVNGDPAEDQEDQEDQDQEDEEDEEDLHYISDINKSLDLSLTVSAADLTENSDFSILESSCRPTGADGELPCPDPEDAQEVEVR